MPGSRRAAAAPLLSCCSNGGLAGLFFYSSNVKNITYLAWMHSMHNRMHDGLFLSFLLVALGAKQ